MLLGFGLVTADVMLGGPLRHADHLVSRWARLHVRGAAWDCARVLSGLGRRGMVAIPLGVATALTAALRRSWRPIIWTLMVVLILGVVVHVIKDVTGRTSPGSGVDKVHVASGDEYPSGHTINGFVMWGMTLRLLAAAGVAPGRWLTRRRICIVAVLLGLMTGVGLVGANWHWLSDVLAGWLLGPPVLWVALAAWPAPPGASRLPRRLLARRKQSPEDLDVPHSGGVMVD